MGFLLTEGNTQTRDDLYCILGYTVGHCSSSRFRGRVPGCVQRIVNVLSSALAAIIESICCARTDIPWLWMEILLGVRLVLLSVLVGCCYGQHCELVAFGGRSRVYGNCLVVFFPAMFVIMPLYTRSMDGWKGPAGTGSASSSRQSDLLYLFAQHLQKHNSAVKAQAHTHHDQPLWQGVRPIKEGPSATRPPRVRVRLQATLPPGAGLDRDPSQGYGGDDGCEQADTAWQETGETIHY